jgi:hypothetical protein
MDGVEGFEPSNDGTKSRCLTTWRYPNRLSGRIIVTLSLKLAKNFAYLNKKSKIYMQV